MQAKVILILLVIAGFSIAGFSVYNLWKNGVEYRELAKTEKLLTGKYADSLVKADKVWKDTLKREHDRSESLSMDLKTLKNSSSKDIDALKAEVGNLKNFIAKTAINSNTNGMIDIPVVEEKSNTHDTSTHAKRVIDFSFHDRWLSLQGKIRDSLHLTYTVANEEDIVSKWYRDKWYQRKKLGVEVINYNPHTTVTGLKTFTIKQSPPKLYERVTFWVVLALAGGFYAGHHYK